MKFQKKVYDVMIIGGGPAGCAAALFLHRKGVQNIVIVEKSEYNRIRIGESIPPDTRILLSELGVWEGFVKENHAVCLGSCSSWGSDELGYNDFLFNPNGTGWHLDRARFDRFLAAKVKEVGIEIHTSTGFTGVSTSDDAFHVLRFQKGEDTEEFVRARYVVDAGGNRSVFAKKMGARRLLHDQIFFVYGFFELRPESSFGNLTLLEATENGWWYGAKLPGNRLAIAVAARPDFIRKYKLGRWENWMNLLCETRHLSRKMSGTTFLPESLLRVAAPSFCLDRVYGDNWLAVGDAASGYDPISSQGVYKALHSGIAGAGALYDTMMGDTFALDRYQQLVESRFQDFLANREYFYSQETRWPDSPFWQERTKVKTTAEARRV